MQPPIAVVGLGIMGSRLAARLLDAGRQVRGFDIDPARMEAFTASGGTPATSPADAVDGCEQAVLSLLRSDISVEVCTGASGIVEAAGRPLQVLDSTTGDPGTSAHLRDALGRVGIDYSDMTVSGNAASAAAGDLVIMFGGDAAGYAAATPVMEVLGRSHHHVGPVGAACRMKLIVNHVLGVNRSAVAEGLVVAELAGLDLASTLAVLRDSAAYSKAMDLWGDRMVAADHERPNARLRQSHKDARLIVEHGHDLGAPVELEELVEAALAEGVEGGLGDKDNSSVIEVLRRRAGIPRIVDGGGPDA